MPRTMSITVQMPHVLTPYLTFGQNIYVNIAKTDRAKSAGFVEYPYSITLRSDLWSELGVAL
jgi:hypothetical protein